MNSLIYLELAKQLSRDRVDEAEARRLHRRARPQRSPGSPLRAGLRRSLRWRPARPATSSMGCTA